MKNSFKQAFRRLGFTAGETTAIIFLIITLASGIIIKYSGWKRPDVFSYTETDKQFLEKTKQDFESLKHYPLDTLQRERAGYIKKVADSLQTEAENQKSQSTFKLNRIINLNTAYAADLMLLPGIGQITAERIIEYRERTGGFRKIEELKNVKGIGDKKFDKIKEYITVE